MFKKRNLIIPAVPLLLLLTGGRDAFGQPSIEVSAGIGFTGVNMDKWSYGTADDWGQFLGGAHLTFFPLRLGGFSLGAEAGFQHLFWYEYYVTGYGYYNDVNTDAFRLAAVIRYEWRIHLFAEIGPGAYFFSEFTDFGVTAAVGYRIDWGKKITLPVKFRTGIVFDEDTKLYPVDLSFGVAYTF